MYNGWFGKRSTVQPDEYRQLLGMNDAAPFLDAMAQPRPFSRDAEQKRDDHVHYHRLASRLLFEHDRTDLASPPRNFAMNILGQILQVLIEAVDPQSSRVVETICCQHSEVAREPQRLLPHTIAPFKLQLSPGFGGRHGHRQIRGRGNPRIQCRHRPVEQEKHDLLLLVAGRRREKGVLVLLEIPLSVVGAKRDRPRPSIVTTRRERAAEAPGRLANRPTARHVTLPSSSKGRCLCRCLCRLRAGPHIVRLGAYFCRIRSNGPRTPARVTSLGMK
mmetsp:Transcript_12621/g.36129  ORF Transcript_12621/g.36129 Transcript_12621/m.36129 type:complete len:275 (-) Transcript_12621:1455-2279(-)